ncbi:TVP38/TMEM64 family protein [Ureibacillus sp. FSL K6-8385]|uniref:TVP38/TMEM64 family membrane protein n=1 Tax=Ureibacillus terrenus TaxID=118246 RepID=A0A540V3U2_9BACL|nr:TVP38/TMEM64 family protein [Ureibacillus terrenus]MED3661797.1 TVP38/TMEM64 family protein [Ureibacillus terrenus]MED3763100.1 TVP38/TMEM64 family protein [Ureibacillus terrenus]TQE91388.1 TVP38/TMEM64 family protein [Ureibacillus terrenus]
MSDWFTAENIEALEAQYRTLGPIIGMLFPFLESFLPFLPLVVFVVANASSHGLWLGFLLSWAGTVLGSYSVFLLVRKFGSNPKVKKFIKYKKMQKLIRWVDMKGIAPLFILLCFPFTPSVLVNIVAGLSNIKKKVYLIVLATGKFVMIFTISVLGYDVGALVRSPIKLIFAIAAIFLLWIIGKGIEKYLNKRVERELKELSRLRKHKKLKMTYKD